MNAPRQQGERCPCCGCPSESIARGIAERVAVRYGYDLAELRGPSRKQDRVTVRRAIACLLRQEGFSLPVIALVLNRDHATILHGLRRIEEATEAGFADALPRMPFAVGADS